MAFLAFLIIGVVMYMSLPVSLLPDIAIPHITVQVANSSMSAREIENSIVGPVRRQLLQVGGLDDIQSDVRDGYGVISMRFDFGTNTDYAYIEVNEKIDAAMNYLPQGTARPKAIKASATDIPVFYVNVGLADQTDDDGAFMQMCDAVDNVIRRRIEQLPEVAMADVTGVPEQCLLLTPNMAKMRAFGLSIADIDEALNTNNVNAGSMMIKDGIYEYSVKVATLLRTQSDVENIYMQCGDRHIQIKDICRVEMSTMQEDGMSLAGGHRVVTLAVIKRSSEGMEAIERRMDELTRQFAVEFPNLTFSICRDQTELLDYTIGNLKQNLLLGFVLIVVVAIFFMGGVRPSVTVCICMMVSVVVTFVPFYIFGRSLNIVSLSGLILVVGMMIDNALVVSENIAQWHQRGATLRVACVGATGEMISPLLTSSLTTVAVFIPLVFIDGMAGSIFADQAFAITAGLAVSYLVGIILLPVIYRQIMRPTIGRENAGSHNMKGVISFYDRGFDMVSRRKWIVMIVAFMMLPMCYLMFRIVDKSKMPDIDYSELNARIEWNEEVNIAENRQRVDELCRYVGQSAEINTAYVGVQDYVVDNSDYMSPTSSEIYWRTADADSVKVVVAKTLRWLSQNHPSASITFSPPANIFEKLFNTSEADIAVEISSKGKELTTDEIRDAESKVKEAVGPDVVATSVAFKPVSTFVIDRKALEMYGVETSELSSMLTTTIGQSQSTLLHSYSSYLPVCIAASSCGVDSLINEGSIQVGGENDAMYVPIRSLVHRVTQEELKHITSGKDGEYIPVYLYGVADGDAVCRNVRSKLAEDNNVDVNFAGAYFSNQKMLRQLGVIMVISLLLMYFILCAQFENFVQPIIVLIEIPIDTAFALVVLWLSGQTLNLMSGIGIIVSCGIIINDSILKIDTINELRKGGMPLVTAVHEAGHRRLRAIVMTSLTTIGAIVPILFTNDMGSELQRPLAIAMIASMTIGTFVSLFIIPLFYTIIENKR